MHGRIFHSEENKSDQRDASHSVRFKAVGAGTNGITGIIACAIGNDAGIARVVFFNFEDDFHQVRADVGNLCKDAAGDSKRGSPKRFADGKTDETRTSVVPRNEQKNKKHHQQLNTD